MYVPWLISKSLEETRQTDMGHNPVLKSKEIRIEIVINVGQKRYRFANSLCTIDVN
jgi:hypothetical protein